MKLVRIALTLTFLTAAAPAALAQADKAGKTDKADCRPIPKGKRILKINLKPRSALVDLFNMYAMLTCKQLNVTADLSQARVTAAPQGELTIEELGQLVRGHAEAAKVQLEETERTIEISSRR